MATATKIEWTRTGDEWAEPTGRFLIVGKNRRYELIEAEQGSIMKRAGKQACMDKAEEMVAKQDEKVGDAGVGMTYTEVVADVAAENDPSDPEPEELEAEGIEEADGAAEVLIEEIVKPSAPEVAKIEPAPKVAPPSLVVQEEERVQHAVDELIRNWDDKIFSVPNRLQLIKRAGIEPEQLTTARINRAREHAREWLKGNLRQHNADPKNGHRWVWENDPEFDERMGPRNDNRTETRTNESEEAMKVTEVEARNLLVAVGLPTSADTKQCPIKKVLSRINRLDKLEDGDLAKANTDKETANLRDKVLEALAAGKPIEITGRTESNGAVRPAKAKKTAKPSGNGKRGGGSKHKVKVGTVIEREYKGKTWKLEAVEDGFKCGKEMFSSLTEAAKKITGASAISGPAFFKLV